MVWKWHNVHKIWLHHVKEREILSLHWKFEVLTPRRSVTMKFHILLVLKVLQNWYAHRTIIVVIFFSAEVKILRTLKEKKFNLSNLQKCPYLRNPLSYTHDLLRENRLYQERSGEKIWSSEDESDQPNQPNQPTRWKNEKWHNFLMS